jgi:hypothetical protein
MGLHVHIDFGMPSTVYLNENDKLLNRFLRFTDITEKWLIITMWNLTIDLTTIQKYHLSGL